jgi:regulator of protease activity HflC (stomatin/prohibitin superfamily)
VVVINVDVVTALDSSDVKQTIVNMTGVEPNRVSVQIVKTATGGQVIVRISGGGVTDSSEIADSVRSGASDSTTPLGRTLQASGATVTGTSISSVTPPAASSSNKPNIGAIIGAVLGGVVALFLLTAGAWAVVKSKKKPTLQSVEL